MDEVVVFNPAPVSGGTEDLLSCVAEELTKITKVRMETCADRLADMESVLEGNATVLASAKEMSRLSLVMQGKRIKILLWQLHPDELFSQFFPYAVDLSKEKLWFLPVTTIATILYPFRRGKVKNIIKFLSDCNLTVMDNACSSKNSEWLGAPFPSVPVTNIFLPMEKYISYSPRGRDPNVIVVGTMSRLSSDFKVNTILALFDNVRDLQRQGLRLKIIVAGSGPNLMGLMSAAQDLEVDFVGHLDGEKINSFFGSIDIYCGMGTTLLMAASRSLPTIVAPYHYNRLKGQFVEYTLFSSSNRESVGFEQRRRCADRHRFSKLLNQIIQDPSGHGKQAYDAFANHYRKAPNVKKLYKLLTEANAIKIPMADQFRPTLIKIIKDKIRALPFYS